MMIIHNLCLQIVRGTVGLYLSLLVAFSCLDFGQFNGQSNSFGTTSISSNMLNVNLDRFGPAQLEKETSGGVLWTNVVNEANLPTTTISLTLIDYLRPPLTELSVVKEEINRFSVFC